MPELPEVETRVREMRAPCVGQTITAVEVLWQRQVVVPDVAEFEQRLLGQTIQAVERRGKYLVFVLTHGCLLMHLRMSGDVLVLPSDAPRSHHLRFALTFANQTTLHFQDARKFGRLYWVADPQQVFASLGAEPLTLAFTPVWLYRQLQHRRRTLKPLLLDQHIIAGLGNIYTDEALYLAGLHPLQNSQQVTLLQAYRLWVAIRSVLKAGIANNGASIDWVYRGGGQQQHFNVYGRTGQACPKCQTSIERRIVGQRSSHFCPVCQPLR